MVMCIRELFLLQCNVTKSPPCVVVSLIGFKGILVALLSVLKVFVCNELVAAKSVCVGEVLIQLDCSSKEFEGCLMLFLQTVAVSYDAPCLRSKQGLLECKVAQID